MSRPINKSKGDHCTACDGTGLAPKRPNKRELPSDKKSGYSSRPGKSTENTKPSSSREYTRANVSGRDRGSVQKRMKVKG